MGTNRKEPCSVSPACRQEGTSPLSAGAAARQTAPPAVVCAACSALGGPSRQMSWHPQYRSSKFRHVFGKPASKENCYDSVPITQSVQDNHFCAVNPHFIAVVTECAGGGAFLVIPLHQTGKLDPHYPKVCGHRGNVLDIKWNPFDDFEIASASEDTTIKIWNIPKQLLSRNITVCRKELVGHARRVGLVEWHPTAAGILFSAGYDYKVMVWNLDTKECVIMSPVKTIDCHQDVILSMSFNTNGSLLATTCKDRKIRVLDPRAGTVLQEANYKGHRASKVLFLGNLKKLLSTGTSRWNNRQMALWDQGDGNIRYYEVSASKPHLNYLTEYRSSFPQKGIGVMPKRGLDVSTCEIFRFYKLITTKSLIEPVSMIVPRRSESYQEDIYPPTAGAQPSLTAREWLGGMNKGPVLVSLRPGSELPSPRPLPPESAPSTPTAPASSHLSSQMEKLVAEDGQRPFSMPEEKSPRWTAEHRLEEKKAWLTNGFDIFECPPPKTENELLQMFYRQQEEIRRLRELLTQREVQAKQLELEIKNLRMSSEWF
ncbi:coronin-2A isoform X3 [Phyllostomus hastatus]|uniref:coronin-2A isoform X3 n=1 Tax=Phyllostomus hastatus TaxID=9423 RepID=UPI001E67E5E3|nr:coronin-2A isoform X3 [Phyllostomus hastatus]